MECPLHGHGFGDNPTSSRVSKTVLDFSEAKGTFFLPYEFRATEIDEHQEQSDMAEQSLVNDEHQEHKRVAEQNSPDNHSSDEARKKDKDEDKTLESHSKLEQTIVQFTQPSCSSNVYVEVCVGSNLSIFRFGHNFIVDASIRKILITNLERPMNKDNLLVSNTIITKHIGQRIVPFRETGSKLLLQQKCFSLFYLKFIYTWIAFLVSYLAFIWSQVRHICYNSFVFRKIKPRFNYLTKHIAVFKIMLERIMQLTIHSSFD